MPRFQSSYKRHALFLNFKIFVFLTTFASFYIFWSQYPSADLSKYEIDETDITQEEEQNVKHKIYRRKSYLPKDLKYILLWTPNNKFPFDYLGEGQQEFINNNCSMINCYVTTNRNFFGDDVTKFHAVAFNWYDLWSYDKDDLPQARSPHQKYIYFNTEATGYHPICKKIFNGYFNWTATYRLDSDILLSYITIKDKDGNIVGPKKHMKWVKNMEGIDIDFVERIQNKSKAAAWFVSHCETDSKREQLVNKLQKALQKYYLNVAVYGACGPFQCSTYRNSDCQAMLEKDYYFYLSLENTLTKDYVTEKLLTALQHNVVPIVYGGADYRRFLPRGSYLNAQRLSVEDLAAQMDNLIRYPRLYQNYFRWKKYYSYHDGLPQSICNVCEALNNRIKYETPSLYWCWKEKIIYLNYDNFTADYFNTEKFKSLPESLINFELKLKD